MFNTHPQTGIAYGVISMHSLDPDLAQDLMYGANAVDLTYKQAYVEAKGEAHWHWNALDADRLCAAAETGADREADYDPDAFAEKFFAERGHQAWEEEDFVEEWLHKFSDMYHCDEPVIEGEYEGIKYTVHWLGGAPLLYVCEGPVGSANARCSPCCPGAADLDSGFSHDPDAGIRCYVPPTDWLAKEVLL